MTPGQEALSQKRPLAGYFEGLSAHELRAPRCAECSRFLWPPRSACTSCSSATFNWERLPGRGQIFTFTVVHHTGLEDFKDRTPYVVALINVPAAGIRVMGYVQASPAAVQIGQQVAWQVDLEHLPPAFWTLDEAAGQEQS